MSEHEERYEPCGLGVCAANEGHDGTCDEASGWADEPFTPTDAGSES
jgi:hypothetical protein